MMKLYSQVFQVIGGERTPVGKSSDSPDLLKTKLEFSLRKNMGTDYRFEWRAFPSVGNLPNGKPRIETLWLRTVGSKDWHRTEFYIATKELDNAN